MCEISERFDQKLLSKLYATGEYSDVTFVVDGNSFRIHKYMLAASCPYFASMLFGNTQEANLKTIRLKDTSAKAFKHILDFIYTGRVTESELPETEVITLLALSHEYALKDLIKFLLININVSVFTIANVVELTKLATTYEFNDFREKCMEFLDDSSRAVVSNLELFRSIPRVILKELLSRDTFVVSEIDLFKALVEWKDANPSENYRDLFGNIRLNLINAKDFYEIVKPTNLVSSEDYVNAIATSGQKARMKCILSRIPSRLEECFKHRRDDCCYTYNWFNSCVSNPVDVHHKTAASKSFTKHSLSNIQGSTVDVEKLTLLPKEVLTFTINTTCDVSFVCFEIMSENFNSYQDYELRVSNRSMEKVIVPFNSGYIRYGKQSINFEPQQVDVFKLTAGDKFDVNLKSICCRRQPRIDTDIAEEAKLIDGFVLSKASLPPKSRLDKCLVFAYSYPRFVSKLTIGNIGYYNPPLNVFVKNKITDEWSKLFTISDLSQKEFDIAKVYIAFIAITGEDLHAISIHCGKIPMPRPRRVF